MFANVVPPANTNRFLYDMSSHIVDSVFFGRMVTQDTTNPHNWTRLYEEMYHAAYDTSWLTPIDDVLLQAGIHGSNDTVSLAIMDWDYNLLRSNAMTSGTFFDFDTVNDLLYDNPTRPYDPYSSQTVFSGSNLELSSPKLNTVFKIDPALIFKDPGKTYLSAERTLQVNFGDGNGWHIINTNALVYYPVNYLTGGPKIIMFGTFNGPTLTSFSKSVLDLMPNPIAETPPDETIDHIPGIQVGVFKPNNCNPNADAKYVIYMEGFDLAQNDDPGNIYTRVIRNTQLKDLKNFGYTFVVVSWDDPHVKIQTHADQIIELIEYLKSLNQQEGYVPAPFVVCGESMGGIIAKYALLKMEQPSYRTTWGAIGNPVAHNTRLYISIDAPHQGANVPMAMQHVYKSGIRILGLAQSPLANVLIGDYLRLLDGSARQLLKHHINSNPTWSFPLSSYGNHPDRQQLLNEFQQMGGYPQFCKKVAIVDGSWTGAHQTHKWDGSPRSVNDKILDMEASIVLRVLGIRIIGTKATFTAHTNPSGFGNLVSAKSGIQHWRIRLRRWGLRVQFQTTYVVSINKWANNLEPYCVMPGSKMGLTSPWTNNSYGSFNFLSMFGLSYSTGSGNLNAQYNVGFPFLANLNFGFNAYSDGLDFDFIPTASAFDYQNNLPLDYPYIQDNVGDIMSKTPFDVVYTNPRDTQMQHMQFLNVIKDSSTVLCGSNQEWYKTCADLKRAGVPNVVEIKKHLLSGEFGDDDWYLENTNVYYQKPIEAEIRLHVDERNPYYNYPSGNSINPRFNKDDYNSPCNLEVVLSKEDYNNFVGSSWSNPTVLRDRETYNYYIANSIMPAYMGGTVEWQSTNLVNCCKLYAARTPSAVVQPPKFIEQGYELLLSIAPNPVSVGEKATVSYKMKRAGRPVFTIQDATGRILFQKTLENSPAGQLTTYTLELTDLSAGLYLGTLSNGPEKATVKIAAK